MTTASVKNPFTVKTPEGLEASVATQLFVDVFTDFYKIREPGHSMLNGPRGSGKSMMFRFLEPDCQCLKNNCELKDLQYFAVLVSIKNTDLNLTEFRRFSNHAFNYVLNEHFLTTYVASKIFTYISRLDLDPSNEYLTEVNHFVKKIQRERLVRLGMSSYKAEFEPFETIKDAFSALGDLFDSLYLEVIQFARRLSFTKQTPIYEGPLCGYLDFLYPALKDLRDLGFMPQKPIYLLMDDADVLNLAQTKILNSWIGTRTSSDVSIKISTQNRYKTLSKASGGSIESPHDYSEVNIADLYTTKRGKYQSRVREIIQKRLELYGINSTPEEFFPVFKKQEDRIEEIKAGILSGEILVSGNGYRPSDDALRYARPMYMASLAGKSKSSSKYMYAGFDQLVHISSGLIRFFLDPAALMFSEQQAKSNGEVKRIEPSIQDHEIRIMSNNLLTSDFDKITSEDDEIEYEIIDGNITSFTEKKIKLRNLIEALGGAFRQKLLSNDTERRVLSIAFTDAPQPDVVEIFDMGVSYGYFQKSTIGNKDGTGRTAHYIMTRRLAPYFNLDPSSFSGYLFVTNERLRQAMNNPLNLLRKIKKQGVEGVFDGERQLSLFDQED